MEVTRGTVYGLGLSQCALTLGVVLFFPPVDVDVYLLQGHINITSRGISITPDKDMRGLRVFMAMPLLLASALAAGFATMTCRVQADFSGQDYQPDVLDQLGMWEMAFWVHCLLAHAIVVGVISDPVDIFGSLSGPCFMVYFLYRACAPKPPNLNITQENLNLLGYGLGVLQMAYQMTETRPNGPTVVMLVVVLDYFLGVGHCYDRQATLDTAANCRLFYVVAVSVALAALYAFSGEFDRDAELAAGVM
jgi:hypothetical protein